MGGVMKTDAIEVVIEAIELEGCVQMAQNARHQLAELKAEVERLQSAPIYKLCTLIQERNRAIEANVKDLEPQWLPAGKLPDEDGWWLWKCSRTGRVGPFLAIMREDGPWDDGYNGMVIDYAEPLDRFAKFPKWEGPKD